MNLNASYTPKQFNLSGLTGISDKTLEMHFKLYEGYVKETNRLSARIAEFLKDGQVDQEEMPAYSELTRRLGFEYNGMVLHEYYFGNMTRGGSGDPARGSPFFHAAELSLGSYATWKTDFVSVGKMRGVGWAICYQDPTTRRLSNHMRTVSRCCYARHGRQRSPKGGRRHDIRGMRPAYAHAAGGRAGYSHGRGE